METNGLYENYFSDLFDNQDIPECAYFSHDDFIRPTRGAPTYLNIFSMNINSLPNHGGIVLTEMGSCNINTVKYFLDSHVFYYVALINNMYGGVGICASDNVIKVQTMDNIALIKTCRCSKCEIESFIF